MVFARVAQYLSGSTQSAVSSGADFGNDTMQAASSAELPRWTAEVIQSDTEDLEAARPPYIHVMLAGGTGGVTGDMLMHSLDTVKTRQQGDISQPPKYTSLASSYRTIWRQEGLRRGLYAGVTPAFFGSYGGTIIFFGTYEWSKRAMIDRGVSPTIAYFTAGLIADFAASPLYVPSEVLKTRLQLQGRPNNPFFQSGYNYRGTYDALRTIIRREGVLELTSGFKATLARDLPFSAIQFAVYEQEQKLAKAWVGHKDIGLPLEVLTGASAGGIAGVLTCPLDVVKTRIQTQLDPALVPLKKASKLDNIAQRPVVSVQETSGNIRATTPQAIKSLKSATIRQISTGGPSTALRSPGQVVLDTESVMAGLKIIYRAEGVWGLFRGVGPRGVWTSIQSGTMLVMYQTLLKHFDQHPLVRGDDV